MQKTLPYGRQVIEEDDIQAVVEVLRGDFLTTGPKVAAFEQRFVAVTQSRYATVCSNGTTALHLAAEAIGLGQGDVAIVPSITFLATANAVRYTGADVVFCDVDPRTGLMTAQTLREALTRIPESLTPKAVFPVHMKGLCVDLVAIRKIADEHGLKIIADACHAVGGFVNGHPVGACVYEDMSVFSFHPVKTIAMGEGGAISTNNAEWHQKMNTMRSHGMRVRPENPVYPENAFDADGNQNPWYYEMPELGYNFRATDMQCALGLSQLNKLERFVLRREELTKLYDGLLAPLAPYVKVPARLEWCQPGWHLYAPQFDFKAIGKSRAAVMKELAAQHILTQVHYYPVHRQPYYVERYGKVELQGADAYYEATLSLPLYPSLTDDDVKNIVQTLAGVIGK